ncbi:MAG TPA: hypothetical protein VMP01_26225 [Pirellulaceae bacterium]|nr:hypothetical protein [Pirellulaceae bacterium]
MDKLKEQLAPVQKHLFWIGCGLIVFVTLFSWYRATSHLKTEHANLQAEITSSFEAVNNIKQNHPNDQTNQGMEGLIQETGEKVAERWAILAKNQEKVLVWPTYAFDQQFIEQVNSLRPPELTVTDGQNEIDGENRRIYRDHVEKVFPKLANIIGAKWTGKVSASAGMGGMGGMGAMPGGDMGAMMGAGPGSMMQGVGAQQAEADDSIVVWNSGNQSQILSEHFSFIASDAALPTTRQILYAQEDLWVLENLLTIIKATNETNGPIAHRHEAAIKTIESIQIGRGAVHESGKVSPIGKAASEGMDDGGGGVQNDMMSQMMGGMGGESMGEGGGPGMEAGGEAGPGAEPGADAGPGGGGMSMPGGMGTAGGGANPADNRYVDRDYQGVLASRLISAMQGNPQQQEDLFLAVAKRVPVRLVFKMDQRRMPTLLAECGNSKLPVEVKQVRINRQSAGAGGGGMEGGMMGGMMGGGPGGPGDDGADMGAMMGGMMGGGMGGAFGGNANNPNRKAIADSTVDPNEIGVEIYGIVYIYNPVNRAALGLKDATPATPPTVTTTPTPTGTTPAAPPVNTGAAAGPGAPVVN